MLPYWFNAACAIALIGVLAASRFRPASCETGTASEACESLHLRVGGMTCAHCTSTARDAVRALPGVEAVTVRLKDGSVEISGTRLDRDAVVRAIEGVGFTVEE
jgi:copper chaperone CopZ